MGRIGRNWKARTLLVVVGLAAACVQAKDLVLAEVHPPGHVIVKSEELLVSRLAELTRGELRIQLRHSCCPRHRGAVLANVRSGTLDIARVSSWCWPAVPAAKLLGFAYLFRSRDYMWRVLGGAFGKRINAEVSRRRRAGLLRQRDAVVPHDEKADPLSFRFRRPAHPRAEFARL